MDRKSLTIGRRDPNAFLDPFVTDIETLEASSAFQGNALRNFAWLSALSDSVLCVVNLTSKLHWFWHGNARW